MRSQIKDLVAMRDIETLYELLEDDDWMTQLDAAEGLIKLDDVRGLEFLLGAEDSEDKQVREMAKEILATPEISNKRYELEAEERRAHAAKVEIARKRLQQGQKVFQYKMVYLPTGEILDEDPSGEGYEIPALTEYGLEGWEVISMIQRRKLTLVNTVEDNYSGAYFLLKKEISAGESAVLDQV